MSKSSKIQSIKDTINSFNNANATDVVKKGSTFHIKFNASKFAAKGIHDEMKKKFGLNSVISLMDGEYSVVVSDKELSAMKEGVVAEKLEKSDESLVRKIIREELADVFFDLFRKRGTWQ